MGWKAFSEEERAAAKVTFRGARDTGAQQRLTDHLRSLCRFRAMGEGSAPKTRSRAREIAAAAAAF